MLILALSILIKQGLSAPLAFQGSALKVSTLAIDDSAISHTDALRLKPRTNKQILPESRASWVRIDGIQISREKVQSAILLNGLDLSIGQAWIYRESDSLQQPVIEEHIEASQRGVGAVFAMARNLPSGSYFAIVKLEPKMPRVVDATLVDEIKLTRHDTRFERYGGALAGMFVALAAFAFVIGLINRDVTFLLFAGWLVTTYRMAAVNGGYGLEWIAGIDPTLPLGQFALRGTWAIHGFLTISLFKRLFDAAMTKRLSTSLAALQLGFALLVLVSPFVQHTQFFKISWAVAAVALAAQIIGLVAAGSQRERADLRLPAIAWFINICGSLLQIATSSGTIGKTIPFLNSQTAAYASGFMIAIALADRLRLERIARLAAQKRAVDALTKYRETYTSVPIGLFTLATTGEFKQVNPSFTAMLLDSSNGKAMAISWSDIFDQSNLTSLRDSLEKNGRAELELNDIGKSRWFRIHAYLAENQIEGSIEDITSRRHARERLQRMADHDALTDLLNRRGIDVLLSNLMSSDELARGRALAFMDMDRFKLVNDMFGHAAGDSVLQQIAERMRQNSPDGAHLARVGGDEFVVVLPEMSALEAKKACQKILAAVNEQSYSVNDKRFSVVASIGLITVKRGMSPSFAVSAADRACADAKRQGGDRVVFYGESDRELQEHVAEMEMVSKIHSSLPVDRMRMLVQPIVSLQAPFSSLSYESLLRVIDDNGRLGPPTPLIQAAERHGFISRLDRWVLDTMIGWLNANPEHRDRLDYCAINLSGASLNDERFLADVLSIVQEHPDAARRLCFEITETVALYDLRNTCRFVDGVRSRGAKVALDDFGAGYTSFSYLKSLQANLVKIDGAFVKTLDTDRSNYAITRTIVDLTHEMSMSCVAEWAESAKVIGMLADMGVDYGQGWGLAKPMAMENLLTVHNCGELVTDLSVIDILQRDREPVFRHRGRFPAPNETGHELR